MRACSEECSQRFEREALILARTPFPIGTDLHLFNALEETWWNTVCMFTLIKLDQALMQRFSDLMSRDSPLHIVAQEHAGELRAKFWNNARQALASNLQAAGRLLEAAQIYEDLRMYDKARKLREEQKQVTIRKIDISVDLNEMIRQIGNGGITAVYRCPHCGGKLKITGDTSVSSLRRCEHCRSDIETMDLVDFLKTALS